MNGQEKILLPAPDQSKFYKCRLSVFLFLGRKTRDMVQGTKCWGEIQFLPHFLIINVYQFLVLGRKNHPILMALLHGNCYTTDYRVRQIMIYYWLFYSFSIEEDKSGSNFIC